MKRAHVALAFLIPLILASAAAAAEFPADTALFFDTEPTSAIPGSDGGVWVGTPGKIVHYTKAGPGATLPVPGELPYDLAMAADGSIWFRTASFIGRISPSGTILEQHSIPHARAIAVASDGALWYLGSSSDTIGRIAGNIHAVFQWRSNSWSLAAADDGQMWVLGSDSRAYLSSLYKVTSTGATTELPLAYHACCSHKLQTLPDGTLYIGVGDGKTILRLPAGGHAVEAMSIPGYAYISDSAGNLWVGSNQSVGYVSRFGVPNVSVPMPGDPPQNCWGRNFFYLPLALDSAGGLWVYPEDQTGHLPEEPLCYDPLPPPMPDLVRIDRAQFLAANVVSLPTISSTIKVILAIALATAAMIRIRR